MRRISNFQQTENKYIFTLKSSRAYGFGRQLKNLSRKPSQQSVSDVCEQSKVRWIKTWPQIVGNFRTACNDLNWNLKDCYLLREFNKIRMPASFFLGKTRNIGQDPYDWRIDSILYLVSTSNHYRVLGGGLSLAALLENTSMYLKITSVKAPAQGKRRRTDYRQTSRTTPTHPSKLPFYTSPPHIPPVS